MTSDGDTDRLHGLFDPDRFRRVDTIFDAALELPERQRAPYVAAACSGDDALRAEVIALLDTAGAAEAAFGENIGQFAAPLLLLASDDDDPPFTAGALVGPWRIMDEIGRGGMGAVTSDCADPTSRAAP